MGSVIAKKMFEGDKISPNSLTIIDKRLSSQEPCVHFNNATIFSDISNLDKSYKADIIFLCIKPQDSEDILQQLVNCNNFSSQTIFISIIAGKKIEFFNNILGSDAKIIRTMPNLAIENSLGIMPYLANDKVSKYDLEKILELFTGFGAVFDTKKEDSFDILTAIFGCGPAYIFLLQEILLNIATKNGLEKDLATDLVKKLFLGSALMSSDSEADFSTLRSDVTSKKGVTESLINSLEDSSIAEIFTKAINNAISRSKELS